MYSLGQFTLQRRLSASRCVSVVSIFWKFSHSGDHKHVPVCRSAQQCQGEKYNLTVTVWYQIDWFLALFCNPWISHEISRYWNFHRGEDSRVNFYGSAIAVGIPISMHTSSCKLSTNKFPKRVYISRCWMSIHRSCRRGWITSGRVYECWHVHLLRTSTCWWTELSTVNWIRLVRLSLSPAMVRTTDQRSREQTSDLPWFVSYSQARMQRGVTGVVTP